MRVATPGNFEKVYPKHFRDQFWESVGRSLKDVFGTNPHIADIYRKRIEGLSEEQQMMAYHQEPIKVAADLIGIEEISEHQQEKYREMTGSHLAERHAVPDIR